MVDNPVVVVGAGAGGSAAAFALAEQGINVLLIERGSTFERESSNTTRYNYETLKTPWLNQSDEWSGPVPIQRALGLGGSTLLFQGVARFPIDVFVRWGMDKSALEASFRKVLSIVEVAGINAPNHPLNPVSSHLLNTCRELNWSAKEAPVAILSRPKVGRPACNYCGLCVFGCWPGDKNSADNTWLPLLKRHPNVKVLTHCKVDHIALSSPDTASSVLVTHNNKKQTIPVQAVVMASGALETPFILRKSQQTYASSGIGNDAVGHFLIDTVLNASLIRFPTLRQGHVGTPIDVLVDEFEPSGIALYQGRNLMGITGPTSLAKYYVRRYGYENVRLWMQNAYEQIAVLGSFIEGGGTVHDKIVTDQKNKIFELKQQPHQSSIQAQANTLLLRWASSSKSQIIERPAKSGRFSGAMLRGSCAIGNSPSSAVQVNGFLRGYHNIVVCDASLLGRGIIGDPSLSIQTLAYHIGRTLGHKLTTS